MRNRLYIAYFDSLGFECIIDLTEYDKEAVWAALSDKPAPKKLPVGMMIMRAKANPQRFPEIWTFQSPIEEKTLQQYAEDNPQGLANLIRTHGSKVFVTPRNKTVIQ